ncbi:unnamed protein product [Acanthoscelides obtectus]|uniref:CREB-regulated transcription coactivator 1 n=1 Tax=Acanthoscelides obtectus TaxID=200917 RepID=A0A9P0JKW4_ACAOB|nr:unnamed protein product [Acanthoscelides obtectus]CAK1657907.1 CREB-regulated transcription coactivator 1 [Acanthoscelides obtectus]
MANPRKFSEKIALHNHRQAEETAAFEQIMKEVIEVTTKEDASHGGRNLPGTSPTASGYRGEGRSRARSQGGPIRRPHDRKLDTSPYSSTSYLSPPTDTGWRRTNSDSALHQSTMQGMVDRNNDSSRGWNLPMMNGPDRNNDRRPRSSCDIPSSRVPGISIHHSAHDPSLIQIPIANTGSLPDLTNVDFSSPIHAPLDQDHSSSPYSSSPVNNSPSTLSPTSITQGVRNQGQFHFTPVSQAQPHSNIQMDKNMVNLVDTDFSQIQGFIYQQQCSPTSSSPTLHHQHQHQQQQSPTSTGAYRSPRPSPQNSPSPGGGRSPGPCSPGGGSASPLPTTADYHALSQQAAQFQQHFEQLSMMDNPTSPLPNYSASDQSGGIATPPTMSQAQQIHTGQTGLPSDATTLDLGSDTGYYSTSPSQLVYPVPSPGMQPNTPNTPTIILTDFSEDEALRQDSLTKQLASEFFSEETLKEGLGSLDFDEFQILANPSMNIPETVEDNFRLDHRS